MVVVAFIHPDLGIGGAERFVVDAAVALKNKGHTIRIFTSHHDKNHCFGETVDGTLDVTAVGDWLPRHIFGRLHALFAYVRMIYVAFYLVYISDYNPDMILCDQISACIPVLKRGDRFGKPKVLFYCHFPDLLLTQRKSLIKALYRKPLDWIEEKTTGMADFILVNSKFTAETFLETFKSLQHWPQVAVLYPAINTKSFEIEVDHSDFTDKVPPTSKIIFLSINRYERKKNLVLALESLREYKNKVDEDTWKKTHLIMAGGYDERIIENKEHYIELKTFADENDLTDHVTFVRSFSDKERVALLKYSTCLIYTPSKEHFGLVPIEAMYMSCPVIACNSGGPLETVVNDVTGFLCDPNPLAFSTAMKKIAEKGEAVKTYGQAGYDHVMKNFSFQEFSERLDKKVKMVVYTTDHGMKAPSSNVLKYSIFIALIAFAVYCISMEMLMNFT